MIEYEELEQGNLYKSTTTFSAYAEPENEVYSDDQWITDVVHSFNKGSIFMFLKKVTYICTSKSHAHDLAGMHTVSLTKTRYVFLTDKGVIAWVQYTPKEETLLETL